VFGGKERGNEPGQEKEEGQLAEARNFRGHRGSPGLTGEMVTPPGRRCEGFPANR
jgi:hypothetical protein